LEIILKNQRYYSFFKLFTINQYAIENLIFYEEYLNFLKIIDHSKRIKKCKYIKFQFLNKNSINQLNISDITIQKFNLNLDSSDSFQICNLDILDDVFLEVKQILFNIYLNFIQSDLFFNMFFD
jgi:hypothetical protein